MKTQFNLKALSVAVVFAVGVAGVSSVSMARSEDINQPPAVENFKKLDVDSDGTLTKTEAAKDPLFTKANFAKADIDNDGTLDNSEYADFKSQSQNKEVKRVVNDSVITSKVKASILKQQGFDGLEVSVETHKGVVQLSGFVDHKDQITLAGKIAKSTEGVVSVKNDLVVKG
ncbi:transporter [Methylovorus sp. MM2]|uniref:BON domain-containing protein n=1 Tax=Methylovorus sp. MM2 TaxID=1848038 RepID=UPI0007E25991|nr:BON domain-containing protein [Methylovorus sp. MM2]OAM52730.1 transporter [Methylovorus sp. MM2]